MGACPDCAALVPSHHDQCSNCGAAEPSNGWLDDLRPILSIGRNNAGTVFIGVDEFNGEGYGVRSYVISMADEHTADRIMQRRFDDMARIMGANVRTASNL